MESSEDPEFHYRVFHMKLALARSCSAWGKEHPSGLLSSVTQLLIRRKWSLREKCGIRSHRNDVQGACPIFSWLCINGWIPRKTENILTGNKWQNKSNNRCKSCFLSFSRMLLFFSSISMQWSLGPSASHTISASLFNFKKTTTAF